MTTKKKRAIPLAVRRDVCRRYGAAPGATVDVQCHYCSTIGRVIWSEQHLYWPMIAGLELDHYVPECAGGETTAANIVLACRPCNRSKGGALPLVPLAERAS